MAKMTMKKWEGSKADAKMDKKLGFKEGSPKDNAADKKAVAKANGKKVFSGPAALDAAKKSGLKLRKATGYEAYGKGGAVKGKC